MACRLVGAKPLSEPMLPYCQLDPKEHILMKSYLRFKRFHQRKCSWKCRQGIGQYLSRPQCVNSNPVDSVVHMLLLASWGEFLFGSLEETQTLQWRHNEHDGIANHQRLDCLLNRLFRHRSQKSSKLRVTGPCEGNSPVTSELPTQRASNVENVPIWWHHEARYQQCTIHMVYQIFWKIKICSGCKWLSFKTDSYISIAVGI